MLQAIQSYMIFFSSYLSFHTILFQQEFPLQAEGRFMRICFNASTDFYGRVTVYQLAVLGGSIEA